MWSRLIKLCVLTFSGALSVWVLNAQSEDHLKMSGRWQHQDGTAWTIDNKVGTAHLKHDDHGHVSPDVECNTMGRECQVHESGKPVKVSMWFSGPKLVELETRGSQVVKRRFLVAASSDTLEVETIPVVPEGRAEVKTYKRR